MGRFIVRTYEGSMLYMGTKLEADSSIVSKVIRGPKISKLVHLTISHARFEP